MSTVRSSTAATGSGSAGGAKRERIAAQTELVKRAAIRAVEEQADLDKIFRAAHSVEVALAGKPPELS